MSAVMPRMIPTFKMLLPTTFPIVMAAFDFKAAVIETTRSHRNDSKSNNQLGYAKA